MLYNTSILGNLANVRQFLVTVTVSSCATWTCLHGHLYRSLLHLLTSLGTKKIIIVSCIQHQIFKVSCFLPICIFARLLERRYR